MTDNADRLLETSQIEEVIDAPGPAQPVVVIQYRTKLPSWLPGVALIVLLPLGGSLFYYNRINDRLRAQAAEAKHELANLTAKNQPGDSKPAVAEPPTPLALNSQPAMPPPVAEPSAGAAPKPSVPNAPAQAPADSTRPAAENTVYEAAASKSDTGPPSGTAGPSSASGVKLAQSPPKPAPPVATTIPAAPTPSPFDDPEPVAAVAAAAQPAPDGARPAGIEPSPPAGAPPNAAPPEPTAPAGAQPGGQSKLAAAPAEQDRPFAPAEPPLPSKEETLRTIREEAARKQMQIDEQFENQLDQMRARDDEERRRFRDELADILGQFGKQAGPEIEKLATRSGRVEDPKRRALAHRIMYSPQIPQKTKVQQLRMIGMPEAFILDDYLANSINKKMGSRNGPRDRNDVWYQAAYLLLRFDLTDPTRDARPAPANGHAGQSVQRPQSGVRSAARGPARSQ
jgi:hypothetical protein